MDFSVDIKELFEAVFESQKKAFEIGDSDLKKAIRNMASAYKENPRWEKDGKSVTTRYNEAGERCAYLLKYAMVHTGLACDVLQQALRIYSVKNSIDAKQTLTVCSLGSGPGTDIVALLFVLEEVFGFKRCQAILVDQSIEWKSVFDAIVSELRSEPYGVSHMVSKDYFSFKYLQANLLNFTDNSVLEAIHNADIITMIKFISAAACKDTRDMVMRIFQEMKPGALLIFIDNAGGGFYEMLEQSARLCNLKSLLGPLKHHKYEEQLFQIVTHGCNSQYKATVTAEIWEKQGSLDQSIRNQSLRISDEQSDREWENDSSVVDSFDEIDYPVAHAECGFIKNSIERDNLGFYNSAQPFSDVTNYQQQNIRLRADSLSSKKDDSQNCCVIM